MILNEVKGSYGNFSQAGRNSTEKYHIIRRKDEILSGESKKVKVMDMFYPDDESKQMETAEDNVDIFSGNEAGERGHIRINSGSSIPKLVRKKESKSTNNVNHLKKHEEHMKEKIWKKKPEGPTCTKYNPQMGYVWKRTLSGPAWDKVMGRVYKHPKAKENEFYLTHKDFEITGRNFVCLDKQTRRKSFVENKNRNIKSSDTNKREQAQNKNKNKNKDAISDHSLSSESFNVSPIKKNISYLADEIAPIMKQKSEKQKLPALSEIINKKKQKKILAPDFKKIISREKLEKIFGDKRTIIPYTLPNYKLTRERPIMMVVYDKATNKKNKYRSASLTNVALDVNYDLNKILDNVNNHQKQNVPNFQMMSSRPLDSSPLPAYMKQIYSRGTTDLISEKTLKLNNYAEGKFMTNQTSFWPKKSFNKIVNLSLLNSEKFLSNCGLKIDENKNRECFGKSLGLSNYLAKSMKFYSKILILYIIKCTN